MRSLGGTKKQRHLDTEFGDRERGAAVFGGYLFASWGVGMTAAPLSPALPPSPSYGGYLFASWGAQDTARPFCSGFLLRGFRQ